MVKGASGEMLPVVKHDTFLNLFYDEGISDDEDLACFRMVKHYSSLVINLLGLKRYYTSHQDRLLSLKKYA